MWAWSSTNIASRLWRKRLTGKPLMLFKSMVKLHTKMFTAWTLKPCFDNKFDFVAINYRILKPCCDNKFNYVAIINISISLHQKKALSELCHWSLLVIASFVDAKVTVIIPMHAIFFYWTRITSIFLLALQSLLILNLQHSPSHSLRLVNLQQTNCCVKH